MWQYSTGARRSSAAKTIAGGKAHLHLHEPMDAVASSGDGHSSGGAYLALEQGACLAEVARRCTDETEWVRTIGAYVVPMQSPRCGP
jgi:hypothetical protein